MIRINQLKMPLKHQTSDVEAAVIKQLRVQPSQLQSWEIKKESLDARKSEPYVVYTIDCQVKDEPQVLRKNKALIKAPFEAYQFVETSKDAKVLKHRPIVVGFGPGGMFAAWLLAQHGYKPIVLERGAEVDKRSDAIQKYWEEGKLDLDTNVQFGEGGAGTFSDGKLTTRIKDLRAKQVLKLLVDCGAPNEILYRNKPHVGTDLLKPTVKAFREKLRALGADIRFETKVESLVIENSKVQGVKLSDGTTIDSEVVVLAIGHSARDTFEHLKEIGFSMTPKPFAMGVRIEHPQGLINSTQYGQYESDLSERYGAAEYHLTTDTSSGRSVYTFCMCPGGFVVGAASEPNSVVTNGMSEHARNQENANSALLVSITPADFETDDILAGMKLQRDIETQAYKLAGENHFAPAMTVGAFLDQKDIDYIGSVKPSYKPGITLTDLRLGMPRAWVEALTEALPKLDQKLNGFAMTDAIMTGFETRTSSPIRMNRDPQTLESLSHKGIYPLGEGAGYAGGIMSSACDGIRVAEQIIIQYAHQ